MTTDRPATSKPPHTPEVLVLSLSKAEAYEPSGREACISISDDGSETPAALSSAFVGILRLAFSDMVQPSADRSKVLFNDDHAAQVTKFIQRLTPIDRIVVHCMAGQSRSPGLALGLCELFSWEAGDLEERCPFWNPWVRQELVRVGREALARTID